MSAKWVLITGCSSGIGQYLTQALPKDGWSVIPTDRIESENILQLDLADSNSIKRAVKQVEDMTGGKLYAIINNAGIAYFGKLDKITRDDLRGQFEVNVFGVHELTNQVIPIFRRNGEGRISFPNTGAYSASKFALEALTDALRLELKGAGIKVFLIEPGTIETNFRKNVFCRDCKLEEKKGKSPEIVYRKVKHALVSKNPKRRYLAGEGYIIYLKSILPAGLFERLIS